MRIESEADDNSVWWRPVKACSVEPDVKRKTGPVCIDRYLALEWVMVGSGLIGDQARMIGWIDEMSMSDGWFDVSM